MNAAIEQLRLNFIAAEDAHRKAIEQYLETGENHQEMVETLAKLEAVRKALLSAAKGKTNERN